MTEQWRLPVKKVTNKQAMQDAQNETIGRMQHLGVLQSTASDGVEKSEAPDTIYINGGNIIIRLEANA